MPADSQYSELGNVATVVASTGRAFHSAAHVRYIASKLELLPLFAQPGLIEGDRCIRPFLAPSFIPCVSFAHSQEEESSGHLSSTLVLLLSLLHDLLDNLLLLDQERASDAVLDAVGAARAAV